MSGSYWHDADRRDLADARWHLTRGHFELIEQKLDHVLNLLTKEQTTMANVADQVNALVLDVQQTEGEVESVKTLLAGLTTIINTLKSQVIDPQTQANLDVLQTALEKLNPDLAAAITTYTPATPPAPEPAPTPAPTPEPAPAPTS